MKETSAKMRYLVLLATSIGAVMNPVLGSMIILAMPAVGLDFTVSARDLGWLSNALILTNAVCLVPAAKLTDKIGYKKSYIIGSIIVSVSCLLSVFAPSYPVLILLRIISGCGISLMMITSLAILTRIFPKSKRGFVIGINTAMVYVGLSVGPVMGGVLTETFGWRSIFALMTPLVLCSAILLFIFMKEEFTEPVHSFDKIGTILYAVAIFCMMYGLSTITEFGSVFLAAAGFVLLIVFVLFELKQKYPILHVGLFFKNKRFSRSAFAALLNYGAAYGVTYFVSLYLQSVGELNAAEAGMIILFQPLVQAVMTPIAGKLSDVINSKYLVTTGMSLTVVGILLLSGLGFVGGEYSSYIAVTQVFIGLGAALFGAPNTSMIMGSVPKEEYSGASGIVSVVRQLGMLISMAVCMAAMSIFVGGTELLGPEMHTEFISAMQMSMIICAGFALVGVFLSWFCGKEQVGV